MIRDARMQALVEKSGEPITPFIDRVRQLVDSPASMPCQEGRRTGGVSSVLVLGGSGDYFEVADTIIRMDAYIPRDVTAEARAIAANHPTGRKRETAGAWPTPTARVPLARSLNPRKGKRAVNIKARALRAVLFGAEEIDISAVAQLVDEGQVRAIGQALNLARERFMQPDRPIAEVVEAVMSQIAQEGLDALDRRQIGDYVAFRPYELAAALNRLRTLRIKRDG
jgi:predicted ABC-class ATPase